MSKTEKNKSLLDREVLDVDRTGILVVDVQDPFLDLIDGGTAWVKRLALFLQVPKRLGVPILVTEQSPEKLGPTAEPIAESLPEVPIQAKEKFNCFSCENVINWCETEECSQLLLVGLMTNVCVLQTAFRGVDEGYNVHVAADGCRAESVDDHGWALQRMERNGVSVTTLRTAVYDWLKGADHPEFGDLLPLLKQLGEME